MLIWSLKLRFSEMVLGSDISKFPKIYFQCKTVGRTADYF